MQKFISHFEGSTIICNRPVSINGLDIKAVDISEEDLKNVDDPTMFFTLSGDALEFTKKPKNEKEVIREEIRAKLESGKVSPEDIIAALKLLI